MVAGQYRQRLALQLRRSPAYMQWHVDAGAAPLRCKLDGMTNVGAAPRKCFCNRAQPNFAHPGQSKPTHCAKCKEDGMVNIRAATCACGKAVPSFATLGTMKATHCNNCKEPGMVNVVSRRCACGKAVPNFGQAGQRKRTHCAQCKLPGMVNLSKNPLARLPLPPLPPSSLSELCWALQEDMPAHQQPNLQAVGDYGAGVQQQHAMHHHGAPVPGMHEAQQTMQVHDMMAHLTPEQLAMMHANLAAAGPPGGAQMDGQEQPPLSVEQAQAVSAALEQLHQASQAMGVQGIHGMGMPLPPGHTQHEQAMQLPLQHQGQLGDMPQHGGEVAQAYAPEAAHLGPPSLPRLSPEQLHGELQAGMPIKEESSQTQRVKRQRVSA
eukprot:jgi/Astpho2/4821/Aster-07521